VVVPEVVLFVPVEPIVVEVVVPVVVVVGGTPVLVKVVLVVSVVAVVLVVVPVEGEYVVDIVEAFVEVVEASIEVEAVVEPSVVFPDSSASEFVLEKLNNPIDPIRYKAIYKYFFFIIVRSTFNDSYNASKIVPALKQTFSKLFLKKTGNKLRSVRKKIHFQSRHREEIECYLFSSFFPVVSS
jgi:hypothetical protein